MSNLQKSNEGFSRNWPIKVQNRHFLSFFQIHHVETQFIFKSLIETYFFNHKTSKSIHIYDITKHLICIHREKGLFSLMIYFIYKIVKYLPKKSFVEKSVYGEFLPI